MDPITIGLLTAATAVAAGGATKTVMDYQAAEQQQKMLNRQAGEIEGAAEVRAGQRMREAMSFRSQQQARASASGVDLTGSPALITAETLASASAESESERRAAGAQAEQLRAGARAANRAGKVGIATGIIGTVGSLAMLGVSAGLKAPPQGPVTAGINSLGSKSVGFPGNITGGIMNQVPITPMADYSLGATWQLPRVPGINL